MRTTLLLAKRNLMIFFRDRSAVFFSLLALLIIIGLYVLFLGDIVVNDVKNFAGESARFLMDSWIMAGTLAVTSMTTTLGAFGIYVQDKDRRSDRDFLVSPIKRTEIALSYIISSFLVGIIMSLLAFFIAEVYIVTSGGMLLSALDMLKMMGLMVLSVFSSTAMMLFLVSFFKSLNAYATASTIIGTLIGFLTGIYVPIGSLPKSIQAVIKLFPPSHAGLLYRQVMMNKPFSMINLPPEALEEIKLVFGVIYKLGDQIIPSTLSMLILFVTGIIFFALAVFNLNRKKV